MTGAQDPKDIISKRPGDILKCIYATKDLGVLRRELGVAEMNGYAVGVVSLSGKVVEHVRGYRGRHAEVCAIAVRLNDRYLRTDDPRVITALFGDPSTTLATHGVAGRPRAGDSDQYLYDWKEEEEKWTWDVN